MEVPGIGVAAEVEVPILLREATEAVVVVRATVKGAEEDVGDVEHQEERAGVSVDVEDEAVVEVTRTIRPPRQQAQLPLLLNPKAFSTVIASIFSCYRQKSSVLVQHPNSVIQKTWLGWPVI